MTKSILKYALALALFCGSAMADGNMGTGGFADDGNMGTGGVTSETTKDNDPQGDKDFFVVMGEIGNYFMEIF
jgi:hypothetical protein